MEASGAIVAQQDQAAAEAVGYAASLGAMRKRLVADGFTPEQAHELVLAFVENGTDLDEDDE